MKKICMVVQDRMVKGGIAAVVNGYRGSKLEKEFDIIYVESYKDGNKFTKLIKGICGYIHFIKVLIFNRPDLVHIHSSFGPSFYRKLPFIYIASWTKKPIINHIHGAEFESFYTKASYIKKKLIKSVYKKCSVIVALSDEWKEKLSDIIPKNRIKVVENYSILKEDAIKTRNNRGLNYQILFLGEIGRRKGCYDMPAIINKVSDIIPNIKFVFGGTGDIEQIKKLVKQYKVEQNVVFTGWVRGKEKDELLRKSDIFILPSYNEGMPMSILDAMGYGLPIISMFSRQISRRFRIL